MSWETAGAESRMGNTFEQGGIDGVYGHEGGYDDFGGGGSGAGDHTCFNCGEPGHNKADCPMPRQFSGACNSCGQEGHMSKDCPSAGPMVCRRCNKQGHMARDCDLPVICPRCNENHYVRDCPLPMICRHCEQEGHLARDCPTAPPRVCHNCLEEGHDAATCKAPRKIIRDDVPEHSPEEALKLIREAVEEKDLDDVKAAVQMYVKAIPEITYVELEKLLRAKNIGLFLIGVEKADLSCTLTNMDFQGNLDKKFTVTYRFQSRPSRPREKAVWPANDEENMARLSDGGEPVARGIPLCMNCKELGHISRNCPIEKQEVLDRATVTCYNCGEPGHRTRDCKGPRMDKFACRNCGQSGHSAKDCPEPRSAENVECRKCGEMGHFSRDCPQGGGGGDNTCRNCGQEGHMARDCTEPRKMICRNCDQEGHAARDCPEPRNMAKMKCHNCDEFGHMSRDCPKPRNMERVQCSNCQEMGHFPSTCTANAADTMAMDEFEAGGADATGDAFDSGGGFGGGANTGGGFGAQTNFGTNNGAQECVW